MHRGRSWVFFLSILAAVYGFALLAPVFGLPSPDTQDLANRLQTPSSAHWMGTDVLGRDLFSRVLYGAQISLTVGWVSGISATILGAFLGGIAGYFGGTADRWIVRAMDFLSVFPTLLLAILFTMFWGRGLSGILAAITLLGWVNPARVMRAQVSLAVELPYVEAARALGGSPVRVLVRHILRNCMGPLLVAASFQIPSSVMFESFLSFMGLGLQAPLASWGTLTSEGIRALRTYPHLLWFPGGTMVLCLMAFQYLSDSLRDELDPKTQARLL